MKALTIQHGPLSRLLLLVFLCRALRSSTVNGRVSGIRIDRNTKSETAADRVWGI